MFVHYRTLGFVLKKEDRGEADQVFVVFSKDYGKLRVLGKAIRKIKSKLRASLQLFYLSEIEFIQGKAFKTLTDVIVVEKFEKIKKDLDKLRIASEIAEVLDNLVKGEEIDEGIWKLLSEVLKNLNENNISPDLIYYYFLWNFFSVLGYGIDLNKCIVCQKKLSPGNLHFSSEQGGIVCNKCFKKIEKGEKIDSEIIKILRVLLKRNWDLLAKLKIKSGHLENLELISKNYLSHLYNTLDVS